MNNIGNLNKKVDIISGVTRQTRGFDTVKDNILYKKVWASIQPLRGREYLEAARNRNDEIVKITIRYRRNVDEGCKVIYQNRIFEVESIADVNMRHEILELRCVEKKRGSTPPRLHMTNEEWKP